MGFKEGEGRSRASGVGELVRPSWAQLWAAERPPPVPSPTHLPALLCPPICGGVSVQKQVPSSMTPGSGRPQVAWVSGSEDQPLLEADLRIFCPPSFVGKWGSWRHSAQWQNASPRG